MNSYQDIEEYRADRERQKIEELCALLGVFFLAGFLVAAGAVFAATVGRVNMESLMDAVAFSGVGYLVFVVLYVYLRHAKRVSVLRRDVRLSRYALEREVAKRSEELQEDDG